MEELAIEIGVTVEKLVGMYPIIREQYIISRLIGMSVFVMGFFAQVLLTYALTIYLISKTSTRYGDSTSEIKWEKGRMLYQADSWERNKNKIFIMSVFLVIGFIVAFVLRNTLTSDYLLLLDIL